MAPISRAFVRSIKQFVDAEDVPLISFKKGERKDDIAKRHLARPEGTEGVLFVGRASRSRLSTTGSSRVRIRFASRPSPTSCRPR